MKQVKHLVISKLSKEFSFFCLYTAAWGCRSVICDSPNHDKSLSPRRTGLRDSGGKKKRKKRRGWRGLKKSGTSWKNKQIK